MRALSFWFVLLSWTTLPLCGQDLDAADGRVTLDSALPIARNVAATAFPDRSKYILYSIGPRVLKGELGGLHWQVLWQAGDFPHRQWLLVRVYMKDGHTTAERGDEGLLSSPDQAPSQGSSADSAAIVRLELELTSLLESGRIDQYAEHLTEDYALTTRDGRLLSRSDALAQWRARGPGIRMVPKEMWVRIYGDAAVLTAVVVSGSGDGKRSRITKLFVRQGGKWRLAALHSSS